MFFPSRVLEGNFESSVVGKGLFKPLDELTGGSWAYDKSSKMIFSKLDFENVL